MGACCGATLNEHTKYINERLDQENRKEQRTNKLLFLGPGGSGKSTIFKQLQWLHGGGFGKEDALMLKEHIYCQITSQMKAAIKHYLLSPMAQLNKNKNVQLILTPPPTQSSPDSLPTKTQDMLGVVQTDEAMKPTDDTIGSDTNTATNTTANTNDDENDDENKDNKENIDSKDSDENIYEIPSTYDVQKLQTNISIVQNHGDVTIFNNELADSIQYIWRHEIKIKMAFTSNEIAKNKVLDETTEYFWDEIDRIKLNDYVPNEADIINVRYRTTGVIEKRFDINKAKFHIFDVGGQKSERKKWVNCFSEVKAVIFVASLSCFNEMMYEDLNKNCMVDSLELFDSTINNKYFTNTHIILFLNKRDLFQKKITKIPITVCEAFNDFSSYNHQATIHSNANDYEQTTCYIKFKFESYNRSTKRKQIYTHLTCAMDKKNIDSVFNDVKHIVITQNLFNEGLS